MATKKISGRHTMSMQKRTIHCLMTGALLSEFQRLRGSKMTIVSRLARMAKRLSFGIQDDIDALPDIEYLIGNTLQACGVSMIFGPSGTGKTFNALNIAYCIAHGIHWFGRPVKQGKVWYINTEGGHGLKLRTAAWRKECGRGKTPNIEFITWPVQLKDHYRELLDTLEEADEKPSLLIVDNYSMCAVGTNQNDQMEVTQALK